MPRATQPLVAVTSCSTPACHEPCTPQPFPLKTLSREVVAPSMGVTLMWLTGGREEEEEGDEKEVEEDDDEERRKPSVWHHYLCPVLK